MMKSWNGIVHTAMLGTDKRDPAQVDTEAPLQEICRSIAEAAPDREELFLQVAALHLAYRQSGFMPLKAVEASMPLAPAEDLPFAGTGAHHVLAEIIETGSLSLSEFWLTRCAKAGKLVQPEWLPLLLEYAVRQKKVLPLVNTCGGRRMEWLKQWNPEWKEDGLAVTEDVWDTGSLDQRKEYLVAARKNNPRKALELLQASWQQEPANIRAAFLHCLEDTVSSDDLPFLEPLLNDKSAKVREGALELLKAIPESSVVQLYWRHLQMAVGITKEGEAPGSGKEAVFYLHGLPEVDAAVYKTGIEKLSPEKGVTDDVFVVLQLLAAVPPAFLQQSSGMSAGEIIQLASGNQYAPRILLSLTEAAVRFKDRDWLKELLSQEGSYLPTEIIDLFDQKEAEQMLLPQLEREDMMHQWIPQLVKLEKEWSPELARAVLQHTAKHPYQYHIGFYKQIIHLLPVEGTRDLERLAPAEEYYRQLWATASIQLNQLLQLKQRTIEAFNE